MGLGRFLHHAALDAEGIVDPRTYIRAGKMAFNHPLGFAKGVGKSYLNLVEHPIRSFETNPFSSALAVTPGIGVLGAASKAGRVASLMRSMKMAGVAPEEAAAALSKMAVKDKVGLGSTHPTLGKVSLEKPPPMLDPSWTPAKGYSHAQGIMDAIKRGEDKIGGGSGQGPGSFPNNLHPITAKISKEYRYAKAPTPELQKLYDERRAGASNEDWGAMGRAEEQLRKLDPNGEWTREGVESGDYYKPEGQRWSVGGTHYHPVRNFIHEHGPHAAEGNRPPKGWDTPAGSTQWYSGTPGDTGPGDYDNTLGAYHPSQFTEAAHNLRHPNRDLIEHAGGGLTAIPEHLSSERGGYPHLRGTYIAKKLREGWSLKDEVAVPIGSDKITAQSQYGMFPDVGFSLKGRGGITKRGPHGPQTGPFRIGMQTFDENGRPFGKAETERHNTPPENLPLNDPARYHPLTGRRIPRHSQGMQDYIASQGERAGGTKRQGQSGPMQYLTNSPQHQFLDRHMTGPGEFGNGMIEPGNYVQDALNIRRIEREGAGSSLIRSGNSSEFPLPPIPNKWHMGNISRTIKGGQRDAALQHYADEISKQGMFPDVGFRINPKGGAMAKGKGSNPLNSPEMDDHLRNAQSNLNLEMDTDALKRQMENRKAEKDRLYGKPGEPPPEGLDPSMEDAINEAGREHFSKKVPDQPRSEMHANILGQIEKGLMTHKEATTVIRQLEREGKLTGDEASHLDAMARQHLAGHEPGMTYNEMRLQHGYAFSKKVDRVQDILPFARDYKTSDVPEQFRNTDGTNTRKTVSGRPEHYPGGTPKWMAEAAMQGKLSPEMMQKIIAAMIHNRN